MWMGPLQTKHMTYSMFPGSARMRQVSTDFLQKHFCIAAALWKQHRIEALLPWPNVCFMFCLDTLDRDNDFHESLISSFQLHTITELHIILFSLFCSTNDTRQILLTVETHGKKESCLPRLFFSSSVVVCNSTERTHSHVNDVTFVETGFTLMAHFCFRANPVKRKKNPSPQKA